MSLVPSTWALNSYSLFIYYSKLATVYWSFWIEAWLVVWVVNSPLTKVTWSWIFFLSTSSFSLAGSAWCMTASGSPMCSCARCSSLARFGSEDTMSSFLLSSYPSTFSNYSWLSEFVLVGSSTMVLSYFSTSCFFPFFGGMVSVLRWLKICGWGISPI